MEIDEAIENMIGELGEWDNIKPALVAAINQKMICRHVAPAQYIDNIRAVTIVINAYLENQLKS